MENNVCIETKSELEYKAVEAALIAMGFTDPMNNMSFKYPQIVVRTDKMTYGGYIKNNPFPKVEICNVIQYICTEKNKTIKIKLSKRDAEISKDCIKIGCQEFEPSIIERLRAAYTKIKGV